MWCKTSIQAWQKTIRNYWFKKVGSLKNVFLNFPRGILCTLVSPYSIFGQRRKMHSWSSQILCPTSGVKDTTWGREPGCSLQSSMSSVVYMTSMWGGQGSWKSSPKITWQKRGKEEAKRRLRSCPHIDMKPWYEAVMGLPPQCDSWVGSYFFLDSWATAQHWKQIISCSLNYESEMTQSHNKRTHKQVN